MSEETTPVMSKDTGEEFTAATIRASIKVAVRRLRLMSRGEVEGRAVVHELAETVLPLIDDAMAMIEGLEEHATWASDQIDKLGEGEDDESQLEPDDADKFELFLKAVRIEAQGQLRALDVESEAAERWRSLDEGAGELLELVDRIRLVDDDERPENGAALPDDADEDEEEDDDT